MNEKPIIGILAARMQLDLDLLDKVATTYTDSIHQSGGIPLILPNIDGLSDDYLGLIDGLVLTGGSDIDPQIYGHELTHSKDVNKEKDLIERNLLQRTISRGMPILGICRGLQMINVFHGGTLVQHIESDLEHWNYEKQTEEVHKVNVEGSILLEDGEVDVNSIHHQGILALGRGLKAVAWSPDGIIEMVEAPGTSMIGVQWHPECINHTDTSKKIFEWVIKESTN